MSGRTCYLRKVLIEEMSFRSMPLEANPRGHLDSIAFRRCGAQHDSLHTIHTLRCALTAAARTELGREQRRVQQDAAIPSVWRPSSFHASQKQRFTVEGSPAESRWAAMQLSITPLMSTQAWKRMKIRSRGTSMHITR